MPTTVIAGSGSQSTPVTIANTYQVGITPLTVSAVFDGTSAAGDFLPCCSFYSQDGRLMGRYKGDSVSAGDTSQQTFAPFLGRSSTASLTGSGIPPFSALDDYVFATATVTLTGIAAGNGNTLLTGGTFVLAASTRVKFEFFVPGAELSGSPPNNQAIGFDIYDGATYKGIGAIVIGNRKGAADPLLDVGGPVYAAAIFTLAAGSHQFITKAWKAVAGGTAVVIANTFLDGSGQFGPMWQRVTTT